MTGEDKQIPITRSFGMKGIVRSNSAIGDQGRRDIAV
jgi:hypothetical protein